MVSTYPIFNGSKLLALANFVVLTCFMAAGYYLIEELVHKWIRTRWRERKASTMAVREGGEAQIAMENKSECIEFLFWFRHIYRMKLFVN